MNKLPLDVTDQLIGLFLLNLSSVGEATPKSVLRHWCRNTSVPSIVLNPNGFASARSFARAYQAVSLLKKYPYGSGVSDGVRRQRAIDKFLDRDAECARTSINFCNRSFSPKDFTSLCVARDFVHKVLGEFSWDDGLPYCDFGPGASIGVPRRQRHKANKIGKRYPTVTGPCHELLKAYMAWAPQIGRAVKSPRVVDGNVVTTVPKNAEIDRVIATEPLWNMFFQKGIGGLISHRLGRIGLHIPTQQGKNREMARLGSLYGTYATLDLSAASDSVSMELVRFMVPSSWWDALVITRSPYSEVDGRKVFLRKIASMGNGYCFELETILFLALAYAVSPYNSRSVNVDIAAYGDDIIVRPEVASELTHLLGVAGFKLNPEKSFITGPFRESCGGHFFDGFDVTPIMLDEQVVTPIGVPGCKTQTGH
nr:MAG: RNA-dependent RNA polymerase [Riboviria sp.]